MGSMLAALEVRETFYTFYSEFQDKFAVSDRCDAVRGWGEIVSHTLNVDVMDPEFLIRVCLMELDKGSPHELEIKLLFNL
jgi:hypothetical protein